jgi:hypothetical protein
MTSKLNVLTDQCQAALENLRSLSRPRFQDNQRPRTRGAAGAYEERTRIEAAGHSRDDQGKEEPFEIPPLRTLRQT